MDTNNQISKPNNNNLRSYYRLKKFYFILVFLSGLALIPLQKANSEEIILKCAGKFEINRGELIKPDWEISYLRINLDGLKSKIVDKGIKKEGRTLIRRDSYILTHRDYNNKIKTTYKINKSHGTYIVEYPQINRILIGTCQKGRG